MNISAPSIPSIVCIIAVPLITGGCDTLPTSPEIGYHTGREVRNLPPGYHTETIGGTRFYTVDGNYYRPRSGRYVQVDSPY